ARSSPDLRIQLVAAIHRDGIALCGHRPGLELDDVGSGWVVLPDGLRDVCAWLTRFPPTRAGLVLADSREQRRHAGNRLGHCDDGRSDRVARSIFLASSDRMG